MLQDMDWISERSEIFAAVPEMKSKWIEKDF